jgi:SAM (Sterile alpha motif) domain-containing protein
MDLGKWLQSLGLEEFEATFRNNKIDKAVLPKLTAEDLKELGVTAVGHRLKLLDAIAALRTGGDAKAKPLQPTPPSRSMAASMTG